MLNPRMPMLVLQRNPEDPDPNPDVRQLRKSLFGDDIRGTGGGVGHFGVVSILKNSGQD